MIPLEVPIDLGPEEARRRAAEELSKIKYGIEIPGWVKRVLAWLMDRLEELFGQALVPEPRSGPGNPVLVVVVIALLLSLVLLVWRVGLPLLNRHRPDGEVGAAAEVSPQQYRTLAEKAADRGDWRTAVRERFRSLVRELEIRTILTPRPSRTAMETSWAAGRLLPAAREPLDLCATTFGDIEYGDTPATEGHYRALTEAEGRILALADRADLVDLDEVPA